MTYCDAAAAVICGSFVLTPLYERLRRSRDADAIDNFFRVNQWNFLLIGEKGTGIFFHKDHLAAASWQAAVVGRKKWILCPFTENNLLSSTLSDKSLHLASPLLPFAPCPSHDLDADTRWLVSVCLFCVCLQQPLVTTNNRRRQLQLTCSHSNLSTTHHRGGTSRRPVAAPSLSALARSCTTRATGGE